MEQQLKQRFVSKQLQTKRLFKNPFIEKLSRTNALIPIGLFTATSLFFLLYSFLMVEISALSTLGLFLLGLLSFSLIEYLMHRFLYHFKEYPENTYNWQYTIHGIHHDFPKDKDRLAMPPLVAIIIATMFFYLFKFFMQDYGFAFFSGFVIGYAAYLFVHYSVHAYKPPKNFLGYLWKHHNLHHYKDHSKAFGVSSPLWDLVFGTMPDSTIKSNKS